MTREEKLSAIYMKMARTGGGTGPGETGYYLPVMIADINLYAVKNYSYAEYVLIGDILVGLWDLHSDSLDKQSDKCIDYVYSLIS